MNLPKFLCFHVAAILLLGASFNRSLAQTTRNVPSQYATIQSAINAAVSGDTILVQPGTYKENLNLSGKNLVLGSLFLRAADTNHVNQTIIDGNKANHVIFLGTQETINCKIIGLTIQNSGSQSGQDNAGITMIDASATIANCRIINNAGDGIYARGASTLLIEGNLISGSGSSGVYLGYGATGTIRNNSIINNRDGISTYQASPPTIERNKVSFNQMRGVYITFSGGGKIHRTLINNNGAGINSSGSGEIEILNCTVANNGGLGILRDNNSVMRLNNSIVWQNGEEIRDDRSTGGSLAVTYSDMKGGWTGTGNINSDPLFVGGQAGFVLNAGSPCIDTGDPASPSDPDGSRADMGTFYFDKNLIDTTPPAAPQNVRATAGDRQITLNWNANTESDFLRNRIYGGNAPNPTTKIDSVSGAANTSKTIIGLTNGTRYYFRITAVDNSLNESSFSNEVSAVSLADQFTKITTGAIVMDGGESRGSGWADYDNDGDLDLLVTNREQNNVLYSNNGNGTFTKITQSIIFTDGGNSRGISWGDYDNDGRVDIFIGNHYQKSYLYHNNGNGIFTKITSGAVVNDEGIPYGVSWGDYDNDGDLDLFVANCCGRNNFLYSNNGNGTFTRVTQGAIVNDGGNSISANWVDYDNDGDLDLFVTNGDTNVPYQMNFLYTNNGNGTFTKVTQGAIVNDQANSWSSSWVDYDNDGDLDLFVGTIDNQNDLLYRNEGNGSFTKIVSGDIVNEGGISFGSSWGDYDNDGDLDLFVAHRSGQGNLLYANNGDGAFTKINAGVIVSEGGYSHSSCWGDFDSDGDLDLFVANVSNQNNFLYANNGNSNHWINIRCIGTLSNTAAIGAKVRVKAQIMGKSVWQLQEISGQTGSMSQNSLNAEFGLGNASKIDSIKVEWPSGIKQVLVNVAVNQFLVITEPTANPKPAAPQNVRATAGDRQITLNWNANTETDFLRYRIYGGTAPNPTTKIDSTNSLGATTKTITNLTNGTRYYFRLTAVDNNLQESGFSSEVSATPSATDVPPAAPQNVQASAGIGAVTLTWNANTESDFLRYRIYSSTNQVTFAKVDSVSGANNTSRTIAGLANGSTYYFRVTAVDAGGQESAPSNVVSARPQADVAAPSLALAASVPNAMINTSVNVLMNASDASGVQSVTLYYRIAGEAAFSNRAMALQSGTRYSANIPASAITNRGAEFYAQASDVFGNVATTPRYTVRVICPNGITAPVAQPNGTNASDYRLFSLPLEIDDKTPAGFLAANPSLGSAEAGKYRWYAFERSTGALREYPNFGSVLITADAGFALLVNLKNVRLKTGAGLTVATTAAYEIALPQGWSLLGNPFNFNVPLDSLRVSAGTFELWRFTGDWEINTAGLEPWQGYAIWMSQAATFSIRAGVAGLNTAASFYEIANNAAENWLIQITAEDGRSTSRFNFVGQHEAANDGHDAWDLHEPLALETGVALRLHAAHNDEAMKADIRSPSVQGHAWNFTCRVASDEEVLRLAFAGVASVPPAFEVMLLDNATARVYDVRTQAQIKFAVNESREKQFTLLAGAAEFVRSRDEIAAAPPSDYVVLENFPNPFNPATQINYVLPEERHVSLEIYNLHGQRVATLVNETQARGAHTVVWRAESFGSGVYFIKLSAGREVKMRKAVLMK